MTCGLIGVRRVLFRQRYRIRRPEKKRNRLLIRAVRWKKSESFPESRSGLRSESEYDFVLRENFRRNSSDISNGRHREFLWGTVNRRIGIRFRHVLRAGRSDVDGRLLTNVSRVSRTSTDFRSLHRNSPPIAARPPGVSAPISPRVSGRPSEAVGVRNVLYGKHGQPLIS